MHLKDSKEKEVSFPVLRQNPSRIPAIKCPLPIIRLIDHINVCFASFQTLLISHRILNSIFSVTYRNFYLLSAFRQPPSKYSSTFRRRHVILLYFHSAGNKSPSVWGLACLTFTQEITDPTPSSDHWLHFFLIF